MYVATGAMHNDVTTLDHSSFYVAEHRTEKNVLKMRGWGASQTAVLVLFTAPHCPYSAALIPLFRQIALEVENVAFAHLSIFGSSAFGSSAHVAWASKNTTTPIRATPALIFYLFGTPRARFRDVALLNSAGVKRFITNALASLQAPPHMAVPPARASTEERRAFVVPPPPAPDAGRDTESWSAFSCPICFLSYGTSRIYQCAAGHSLCHDCAYKLAPQQCPQCRKPLCGRNTAMEHAAEVIGNMTRAGSFVPAVLP
uniref:Thioredoxin-like protein n=1 Tax=Marseillevirus LCMAC103 TaxID=2506604 RepID=A0A481YUC3_9VIRU|nr:MAG: thioredoxin-like protein [Marseillevirus LCMAC103]